MLLQLFQETFSDPGMYGYMGAGAGIGSAVGSVLTMGVQKLLNKNKEDVDITTVVNQQVRMLFDNGEFKDKIIKELQEWACYREHCRTRMNGADDKKEPKKKT